MVRTYSRYMDWAQDRWIYICHEVEWIDAFTGKPAPPELTQRLEEERKPLKVHVLYAYKPYKPPSHPGITYRRSRNRYEIPEFVARTRVS